MKSERETMMEGIRNASPLNLATKLQEAELYDKKATREVVDEIYKQFNNGGHIMEQIVFPVFTSIIDGFLEINSTTRKLRKHGLTTSRILRECQNFKYPKTFGEDIPDAYTEYKNIRDTTNEDMERYSKEERGKFNRETYEDKTKLGEYKDNVFDNNGGKINAVDEYTGQNNAYRDKAHPDARRNIIEYKHSHLAEVDHIVPLKQIYNQFQGNYALTDEDIKNIANQDSNYALTTARINRGEGASGCGGKFDKTNTEFVEDQRQREKESKPNLGISEEAKENMLKMEKDAQKTIEDDANKAIVNNFLGQGTANTNELWSKAGKNAVNQSKDYVIGNVILYLFKPLYYEVTDIVNNGLCEGVNTTSTTNAFKIRFGRLKDYLLDNALKLFGNNIWEFVKGFISSLIEGIISLFIGVFKQILKLVKEGIKILAQAGKVLFGENSKNMSSAEKGDAIIKILGGAVISICGIGIEALLSKLAIPETMSVILSTTLTGIASVLFMNLLDRMDLFSVKGEKRLERIEDIFTERINDIKDAQKELNTAALENLRLQNIQFSTISNNLEKALSDNNQDSIDENISKLVGFFHVDLPYKNHEEFLDYMDETDNIKL